jgi:hypothetical protein
MCRDSRCVIPVEFSRGFVKASSSLGVKFDSKELNSVEIFLHLLGDLRVHPFYAPYTITLSKVIVSLAVNESRTKAI